MFTCFVAFQEKVHNAGFPNFICPENPLLPIFQGASFLSRTNDLEDTPGTQFCCFGHIESHHLSMSAEEKYLHTESNVLLELNFGTLYFLGSTFNFVFEMKSDDHTQTASRTLGYVRFKISQRKPKDVDEYALVACLLQSHSMMELGDGWGE